MAIQYTPSLGLPYPEVTDTPLIASRDFKALAQKMDTEGATIKGTSAQALSTAQDAEATADLAMTTVSQYSQPVHVGPDTPVDGEVLWVDTDEAPTPVPVAWADVTGKPEGVGYSSGWRDITARITGVVSGTLWILRDGNTTWARFDDLVVANPSSAWVTLTSVIPYGFRLNLTGYTWLSIQSQFATEATGPVRMDRFGSIVVYGAKADSGTSSKSIKGLLTWPTNNPIQPEPGAEVAI